MLRDVIIHLVCERILVTIEFIVCFNTNFSLFQVWTLSNIPKNLWSGACSRTSFPWSWSPAQMYHSGSIHWDWSIASSRGTHAKRSYFIYGYFARVLFVPILFNGFECSEELVRHALINFWMLIIMQDYRVYNKFQFKNQFTIRAFCCAPNMLFVALNGFLHARLNWLPCKFVCHSYIIGIFTI